MEECYLDLGELLARLSFSTSLTFEDRPELVLRQQQGGKNLYLTGCILLKVPCVQRLTKLL